VILVLTSVNLHNMYRSGHGICSKFVHHLSIFFFLRLLDSNDACKQYADGNEVEFRVFFPIQILFFVIL
jgi:hypothetical protein